MAFSQIGKGWFPKCEEPLLPSRFISFGKSVIKDCLILLHPRWRESFEDSRFCSSQFFTSIKEIISPLMLANVWTGLNGVVWVAGYFFAWFAGLFCWVDVWSFLCSLLLAALLLDVAGCNLRYLLSWIFVVLLRVGCWWLVWCRELPCVLLAST